MVSLPVQVPAAAPQQGLMMLMDVRDDPDLLQVIHGQTRMRDREELRTRRVNEEEDEGSEKGRTPKD